MKKLLLSLLFTSIVFADEMPLSTNKIELLNIQREQIKKDLKKNKNSWISPIMITGFLSENTDISNEISQTKNVSLSWNQDVFRFGGIFYTIDKAKALSQFDSLGIDLQEAAYLKNIYTLKAQIQRDKLLKQQSHITLENREIDLYIITQKYKVGSTDISELNRVTVDKDNAKTQIIVMENTLNKEKFELKKVIGDKRIEDVVLLNFELISKENYLKNNIELLQLNAKNKNDEFSVKITNSSFYPKLTFNSSYGYTDYNGHDSYTSSNEGDNYSYGLSFSMPIDINKNATIESSKLQYLKTKLNSYERKNELIYEYDKKCQSISDLNKKVDLAKDTKKIYEQLYDFTEAQVAVGAKSSYDLESLANSVEIQKLEVEIQNYNILIEKISLFFDVKH